MFVQCTSLEVISFEREKQRMDVRKEKKSTQNTEIVMLAEKRKVVLNKAFENCGRKLPSCLLFLTLFGNG